jgi:hypothetical protein
LSEACSRKPDEFKETKMPTKSEAMQRPTNLGEVITPATPFAQNVPPIIPREQPGLSPTALGPAPSIWTSEYDKVRQWMRPGTSQGRFPTLPTKANPQLNASSRGVSTRVVAPVAAQTATNTTGIAANGAAILTLQQTNFQGVWSSGTVYQINASVDYLGKLYYSLVANNLNNIPASSPTDWRSLGSDAGFAGVWSSLTAYKVSQQVTASDGNYYIAIVGSTNVNPVGNPATWQLVGPANLGSLIDGSSRFAATGSTLTYRPLTNPLTTVDVGATETVNVAAFTMRTSSKGDISINSGAITGLFHGDLYYIYYDDPTLAGGAVTFNATGSKEAAIGAPGRFFVGSIVTAVGGGTVGNNDGGVGAQAGSSSIFLGGSFTTLVTTNVIITGNLTNFFDGSLTTSCNVSVNTGVTGAANGQWDFKGMSPTSAPWSSLTLNVRSAVPTNTTNCTAQLQYSLDGGGTFTNIYNLSATTRALTTDTITLPIAQNLALLVIRATIARSAGSVPTVEMDLYEWWVLGLQ